jgi:hypothetical protein
MITLLFWVTAAFAYPPDAINTYSFDIGADYKLKLEPVLGTQPLTSQLLESELGQSKDYPAFLSSLKARFPELFLAPVFLHSTGSLQRADFHHPRVILYGRGSMLTLGGADKNPRVERFTTRPKRILMKPPRSRFPARLISSTSPRAA